MDRSRISTVLLLAITAQVNSQFFDFFGVQPVMQSPKRFNDYPSMRTKVVRVQPETQMSWKNTTYSFSYDGIEKEVQIPKEVTREKKRRQPVIPPIPTLIPIFNVHATQKPVRKTTKLNTNTAVSGQRQNSRRKIPIRDTPHDVGLTKNGQSGEWYERPTNKVADYNKPYEATTKAYYRDYNNRVIYNTNDNGFTTKDPFYSRPGVKTVLVDNGPPITNKPVTQRPYRPDVPHRPGSENPYRPVDKPYRPEPQVTYRPVDKPYRPEPQVTYRPDTEKPRTVKPYIVNPIPTQAGAVVFPEEDDPPEIIRGPDEEFMSDAEKRRYIEMAEKMCDRYKLLNMKQLSAIPLLPSPEPVSVNVSQCTPTQIPLVVGGKVVTINEFPHMALLGWVKVDGGGYSWKCGGSLISDQYVLTAAHCSFEDRDNTVITGPPRVVQFGSSYLDDPGALVVRVAAIIRHPKYKFPMSYYDLAILKLNQPVSFSEVIKPACLGVPPPTDQPIIATGWGKTEFGGDQSVELRSVSLPVWDNGQCQKILGTSRRMPQGPQPDSQMCAGEKRGGKDTCQGDSGGPAQLQDGCAWRVVAVTSLGRSCGAPNTPGVYALVQRAFVAAAVFGNIKNSQHRSDTNQPDHNQGNNGYKTNPRTTTEVYNQNGWQNGNRRTTTTTTTQSYLRQNSNRRTTTTTDSYYNPRQSSNRRTTTTESYYNPQQNNNERTNNNYRPENYDSDYSKQQNYHKDTQTKRPMDTNAGFYEQQNDRGYYQPQSDFWGGNRPQRDYNRNEDRRFEPGAVWYTK